MQDPVRKHAQHDSLQWQVRLPASANSEVGLTSSIVLYQHLLVMPGKVCVSLLMHGAKQPVNLEGTSSTMSLPWTTPQIPCRK